MGFDIGKHQHEYHYNMYTMVTGVLPTTVCDTLCQEIDSQIFDGQIPIVDHSKVGTSAELDEGGRYLHHIFDGPAVRKYLPFLQGLYYGLKDNIASIVSANVITSPHQDSDVNIKAYPPHGGTVGWHKDTNGITCLVYLTSNTEGALVMDIERTKPWMESPEIVQERVYAVAGSMLLMRGREVRHMSEPTAFEKKYVAVFNYYEEGDTWRPEGFDNMVYRGIPVAAAVNVLAAGRPVVTEIGR